MTIDNAAIRAERDAYIAAKPAGRALAALASDATDYMEALADPAVGLFYTGHRVMVRGGLLFCDGVQATKAALRTKLTATSDAADLTELIAELKAKLTPQF